MTFNSSPHIAFDKLPDSTQYQLQAIPVLSSKFGYKHKNFTLIEFSKIHQKSHT